MRRVQKSQLNLEGADDVLPTIEVDTANNIEIAQLCIDAIRRGLRSIQPAKWRRRVTIYSYETVSINFGDPTESIFFGVAGPEKILLMLHAILGSVPGARVRYGDEMAARGSVPILHLEDGTVWQASADEWVDSAPIG